MGSGVSMDSMGTSKLVSSACRPSKSTICQSLAETSLRSEEGVPEANQYDPIRSRAKALTRLNGL